MPPARTARANPARWLLEPRTLLVVYAVIALAATFAKLASGTFLHDSIRYEPMQNWAIYRNSWLHLIHRQDLYGVFRLQQWDQFKYSPTFVLLIAPLAVLPYAAGVLLWNLLNMVAIWAAVMSLPLGGQRQKAWVLWFALLSAVGSMQNAQSNGLVLALMIGAWAAHERNRTLAASLCLVLSVYVKLFGVLALLPCLLRRRDRGKLLACLAGWMLLLGAAPLLVVGPRQMAYLYQSWYQALQADHATRLGMSIMGLLRIGLHLPINPTVVVLVGGAILVSVPLARRGAWAAPSFRLLVLASVLIWVVMFSHMAESPSFVIAVAGIALWYFFQERSAVNLALLLFAFAGTCLSSTSLLPHSLRVELFVNYVKLLPCIAVWLKLLYDLSRYRAAAGNPLARPRPQGAVIQTA